ncbi:MAG: hypothetical protein DRP49_07180 [Spirochaetes bacterium]|nr:MAG: hypothetical protein DRP49_07180 [Spirochaetota bacterium]
MPTVTQPGGEEPRFSIAFLLSIINKAKVAEINLEDFTRDGFSERYRVSVMLWKLSMNVSPYTGLREGDALLAEKLVDEQERYLIFQPELDISQVYIKRMWVLGPLFFATVSQGLKDAFLIWNTLLLNQPIQSYGGFLYQTDSGPVDTGLSVNFSDGLARS